MQNEMVAQKYDFMLSYMNKLDKISLPFLKQYNLKNFWYSRFFKDGSFIDIGNHPSWFQHVLKKDYYNFHHDHNLHPNFWPSKEIMLISTPKDLSKNISLKEINCITEKYKIYYLFNLIVKRENYLENFGFSAPIEQHSALVLYSKYFGVLKAFGIFFSQKYSSLIQEVETHGKIFLPIMPSYDRPQNLPIFNQYQQQTEVWNRAHLKYYFITTEKGEMKISLRQRDCLSILSQGYSAKEAAQYLDISPKTFETHLLRLKDKTSLTRYGLIQAFIQSGL